MAQRETGLYTLLNNPRIYETVQQVMGQDRGRKAFAENHIRARPGDRVLDIGCGPAQVLAFLPDVDYVGWEPNPHYVAQARKTFGRRGSFNVGLFTRKEADGLAPFDIAIVSAVLHHLNDQQAHELFGLLRSVLKPDGRVVSIDNVYVAGQNPIAKLLISLDRGRNVRSADGYKGLASGSFKHVEGRILHKRFPPYTLFVMTAS